MYSVSIDNFASGPEDLSSIPGRIIPKTIKIVLDTSLLNNQQYKVRMKGKVEYLQYFKVEFDVWAIWDLVFENLLYIYLRMLSTYIIIQCVFFQFFLRWRIFHIYWSPNHLSGNIFYIWLICYNPLICSLVSF